MQIDKIEYYPPVVHFGNGYDFAENVGKPLRLNKVQLV